MKPLLIGALLASIATTPTHAEYRLDGQVRTPKKIDTITTASGAWTVSSLGQVQGMDAVLIKRGGSIASRVMICRPAALKEAGDPATLDLRTVTVKISAYTETFGVAPGSCRVGEDAPLVQPRADWIVKAVQDGRLPAYTRERSWIAADTPPIEAALPYDPSIIGNRDDLQLAAKAPFAGMNFVGVTSGQGGEYPASRGFLHNVDARVVDRALHGEPLGDWATVHRYTLESLGQPQGAQWSALNHTTADPQFPLPGDQAYATTGTATSPTVVAFTDIEGWGRDVFHLENTCYVEWLATADPVAGLCVQRQLAFALAEYPESYRAKTPTTYAANSSQQRGILNTMSALWKSRDVASHMTSQNGTTLWNIARLDRMRADVFAYYDPFIAPAPSGDPEDEARRISGAIVSPAGDGFFVSEDGATITTVKTFSGFMLAQYGKEPLYLWAKAGDPFGRKWLEIAARHVAARFEIIGGARGVNNCSPLKGTPAGANGGSTVTNDQGSNFPLGPSVIDAKGRNVAVMPGFTTLGGWAAWAGALCTSAPTNRYDQAELHTLTQMEGLILLARDAGVSGLDSTIARITADRARTEVAAILYRNLDMAKHWAGPVR